MADITNLAYMPRWAPTGLLPTVALPDTAKAGIDPLTGTGWDRFLDAAGASEPGGTSLAGGRGLPSSPIRGLQAAAPMPPSHEEFMKQLTEGYQPPSQRPARAPRAFQGPIQGLQSFGGYQ